MTTSTRPRAHTQHFRRYHEEPSRVNVIWQFDLTARKAELIYQAAVTAAERKHKTAPAEPASRRSADARLRFAYGRQHGAGGRTATGARARTRHKVPDRHVARSCDRAAGVRRVLGVLPGFDVSQAVSGVPSDRHVPGAGALRIPLVDGPHRHAFALGKFPDREVSIHSYSDLGAAVRLALC